VGEVLAPVSEPGVSDSLQRSLGAAIRSQGAAGEHGVTARVDRALCEPAIARSGQVHGWSAELAVTFTLLGPRPLELALSRSAVFELPAGGDLPSARAHAFDGLAEALSEEAISLFLYAPPSDEASTGGEP
jgi:hypothetical protein